MGGVRDQLFHDLCINGMYIILSCYVFSLCPVMFCSFRGFLYKEGLEYLWQDDFLNEIAFY